MEKIRKLVTDSAEEAVLAAKTLQTPYALNFMEKIAHLLATTFRNGGKVLIAGNGGSLCDAAHFAEELTGVFRKLRPALPAIVLSESGHITCVGNDLGYEAIFSRGVEAFGKEGDVFIGLTTSGNSANLIKAFATAKEKGLKTVAFLGRGGGKLAQTTDYEWIVNGFTYSDRVQEAHMAAIHIILEAMECLLFPTTPEVLSVKELATVS